MIHFQILSEYKISNADIILKEDSSCDDLIDVIEGNRVYIPCIYVLNKIDQVFNTSVISPSLFRFSFMMALRNERMGNFSIVLSIDKIIRAKVEFFLGVFASVTEIRLWPWHCENNSFAHGIENLPFHHS